MSERSAILVSVNGPDHPGISAGLMDVLSVGGAEIYDIEQIVVRGRLTLNILIGVAAEQPTIRDLLFFGWEAGLHIEFEVVDTKPSSPESPRKTLGRWRRRSPRGEATSNASFDSPDTR